VGVEIASQLADSDNFLDAFNLRPDAFNLRTGRKSQHPVSLSFAALHLSKRHIT